MLKNILRFALTLAGICFGYGVYKVAMYLLSLNGSLVSKLGTTEHVLIPLMLTFAFAIIFYLLTPTIARHGRLAADSIGAELKGVSNQSMIASTFGLIVGFLIASLLVAIYEQIEIGWLSLTLTILTYVIFGFLGVAIATRKQTDFANMIMGVRRVPLTRKSSGNDAMPKILDTSVIIDGRILDVMRTGIIEGKIIIPEFVLIELQHIADSSDSLKRQRGRRGLDMLGRLQNEYGLEIYATENDKALNDIPEVDIKLLKLAQTLNGRVVTNDYNLNKVANIKEVPVLNINELASMLKPVVLPGETMNLFLVKEGKENGQAVAYLDDGTMIVVEDGRKHIGTNTKVIVTSVLQTASGRMIFAKAN